MTDKQKRAAAEIRKENDNLSLIADYVNNGCPPGQAMIYHSILKIKIQLDALEADGKCKYEPQGTFAKECDKCGTVWNKNLADSYFKHCPGCGREIEATT